jgi:hypothetical protein
VAGGLRAKGCLRSVCVCVDIFVEPGRMGYVVRRLLVDTQCLQKKNNKSTSYHLHRLKKIKIKIKKISRRDVCLHLWGFGVSPKMYRVYRNTLESKESNLFKQHSFLVSCFHPVPHFIRSLLSCLRVYSRTQCCPFYMNDRSQDSLPVATQKQPPPLGAVGRTRPQRALSREISHGTGQRKTRARARVF